MSCFPRLPLGKRNKRKNGGKTLLFVSNELNQTDCLARGWCPSGGLIGNVVSLCLN